MPTQNSFSPTTSSAGIQWTLADAAGELAPDDDLNRTTRVFIIGFRRPEDQMYFIDEIMPEGFRYGSGQREDRPWIKAESYQYGVGNDKDVVLGQSSTIEEAIAAIDAHASFEFYGTVSSGTMRSEDLIPAFLQVLETLDPKVYTQFMEERIRTPYESPEDAVEALFNLLGEFAPAGYYFGAHPGDGSDYGFWPLEDNA